MSDVRIIHVFSEHLDDADPRVTGIPLGVNPGEFPNHDGDFILKTINLSTLLNPINGRPLLVLQSDRIRDGLQWLDRVHVRRLCQTSWASFCVSNTSSPGTDFFTLVQKYPFVVCVHGGGLDPSPKAWESLLLGSIPIMQHYPGDGPYRELPVVFVDNWDQGTITVDLLRSWMLKLSPHFTDAEKRAEVLHRLSSSYWWDKVEQMLQNGTLPQKQQLSIEWRAEPEANLSTVIHVA